VLEAAGHADGGNEFRHDDVRPEAPAQEPEGGLGHARHGGEEQGEIVPRVVREVHATQRNDALRGEQPVITFRRRFDRRDYDVRLREFFAEDAINLQLQSTSKDDVLKELVSLLKLDDKSEQTLVKMLKRRETLGSTGIGQNIAIPHCRALAVNRLRVAFGRKLDGIDFNAIDGKPVHYFFLIVAPPLEVSNQYLPVLGKIAQFAKEPDVPGKLAVVGTAKEFLKLLEDKNI